MVGTNEDDSVVMLLESLGIPLTETPAHLPGCAAA